MDFGLSADHRVHLKVIEKKDKNQDLARELKILLTMKMTVIPIVRRKSKLQHC